MRYRIASIRVVSLGNIRGVYDALNDDECARSWEVPPGLWGRWLCGIGRSRWPFHNVKSVCVFGRPVWRPIRLNRDRWERTWVVVEGSNVIT